MENILKKTPDTGVSPIVSVILMIMITVMLAGVVAGAVMTFGGLLEKPAQAGVSVEDSINDDGSYDVKVVVNSMPNAKKVTVQGPAIDKELTEVGDTMTLTELEEGDNVIVVAQSPEGSESVMRDYVVGR